jgi:hypothetical protein
MDGRNEGKWGVRVWWLIAAASFSSFPCLRGQIASRQHNNKEEEENEGSNKLQVAFWVVFVYATFSKFMSEIARNFGPCINSLFPPSPSLAYVCLFDWLGLGCPLD